MFICIREMVLEQEFISSINPKSISFKLYEYDFASKILVLLFKKYILLLVLIHSFYLEFILLFSLTMSDF